MPPLTQRKGPAYSISPRSRQRSLDVTPGPNTYSLPSTLGDHVVGMESGPGVSMLPRNDYFHFAKDLAKSPGPARYEVKTPSVTKRSNPKFSITGRNRPPSPKNIVPGPGAYSPETVTTHIKSSPRYHIGVKHSDFMLPTLTLADVND
ncbi:hypothetical protein CHS0354_021531 [Potamilus streckersoni]|uniref:Outer dense fiber protein 3-like protein 2 n=1 Tax=Potamilus streckersoni TaxID=2493646 RepID=A0AAE0VZS4_9BIVA|nr:hypothetical protein CHS0354_021531 [Potamilus streckersoni]